MRFSLIFRCLALRCGSLALTVGHLSGGTSTPEFNEVSVLGFPRSDTVLVESWTGGQLPDLLVVNQSSESFAQGAVHLIVNEEAGWAAPQRLLADVTGFAPTGGVAADFNGDGLPDLLTDTTVINGEALLLFLNDPSEPGRLTLALTLPFGFGMATADLNGNGFPDLLYLDTELQSDPDALVGRLYVYFNKGIAEGVWQGFEAAEVYDTTLDPGPENPRSATHLATGDFTGNGWSDIATDTLVLLNEGESRLRAVILDGDLAESPLLLTNLRGEGKMQLVQGRLESGNALSPREATIHFYDWDLSGESWEPVETSVPLGLVTAFNLIPVAADVSENRLVDLVVAAGSHLFFLTGDRSGEALAFAQAELARHYLTEAETTLVVAYSGTPGLADLNGDGTLDIAAPRGGTQIIPYQAIDLFSVSLAPVTVEVFTYFSFSGARLEESLSHDAGLSGVQFQVTGPTLNNLARTGSVDRNGNGVIERDLGEVGLARFVGLPAGDYEVVLGELEERLQLAGEGQLLVQGFDALPGDVLRADFGLAASESGLQYQGGIVGGAALSHSTGPLHLPDIGEFPRLGDSVIFATAAFWTANHASSPDGLARVGRDGIFFKGPAGQEVGEETIRVGAMHSGAQGYLNLWRALPEQPWTAGEWVVQNAPFAGAGAVEFEVGTGEDGFPLAFRARISSTPLSSPTELTLGGETEDYLLRGYVFGSAPDSYSMNTTGGGALHPLIEELYLGRRLPEPEFLWPEQGQDRPRNRRGVMVTGALEPGRVGRLQVLATGEGFLQGWIDFGHSGFWDAAEDAILVDTALVGAGAEELIELQFNVPVDALPGLTYARVRFSSRSDVGPTGPAFDGEVEDFAVQILAPTSGPLRRLLEGADPLGGGWLRSRWFGVFRPLGGGWIFHGELGFVFLGEAGSDGVFVHVDGLGWLFTTEAVFPYFYSYNEASFAYLNPERTYPDRWFYIFTEEGPGWRNIRQALADQ